MAESFKRSAEHILLTKHLQEIPVGDSVTYQELDRVAGVDVRRTGLLATVKNAIALERFFFVVDVRGESIRRVDDADWNMAVGPTTRNRIRKLAKRGKRKLVAIVAEELAPSDRLSLTVNMTILNLHEFDSQNKVEKRIQGMYEANESLALKNVLERLKDL